MKCLCHSCSNFLVYLVCASCCQIVCGTSLTINCDMCQYYRCRIPHIKHCIDHKLVLWSLQAGCAASNLLSSSHVHQRCQLVAGFCRASQLITLFGSLMSELSSIDACKAGYVFQSLRHDDGGSLPPSFTPLASSAWPLQPRLVWQPLRLSS